MGFVQEKNKTEASYAEQLERDRHNAQINECYQRLLNIESDQFGSATAEKDSEIQENTVRASVITPERPVVHTQTFQPIPTREQTPYVTEYVRTKAPQGLLDATTIERIQAQVERESVATYAAPTAPVYEQPTVISDIKVNKTETAVRVAEESYSLTTFAKLIMAVFATIVVAMLTLICVNTQLINQKNARLEELEIRKAELIEQNAEVQRRIAEAKSEETIQEYALSQGMVQIGE